MQWVSRVNKALREWRFNLCYQSIVPLGESSEEEPPISELPVRLIDERGELVAEG